MEDFAKVIMTTALAVPRIGTAFAIAPFFGSGLLLGIPRRGFILSTALVLIPMLLLAPFPQQSPSPLLLCALVVKETLIGLLFGFGSSIGFWAMQAAGEYIDSQRGATAGAYFNPLLRGLNSPMGGLMLRFSIMLFLATRGFVVFLSALLTSFEIYPLWNFLPELKMLKTSAIFLLARQLFELSILYSAPLLVLFLLIDLGLGFMNRFVPSLNVFFFSLPVKSVAGLLLVTIYLPFVARAFSRNLFSSESLSIWIRSVLS
jgi:type III secretion protein T